MRKANYRHGHPADSLPGPSLFQGLDDSHTGTATISRPQTSSLDSFATQKTSDSSNTADQVFFQIPDEFRDIPAKIRFLKKQALVALDNKKSAEAEVDANDNNPRGYERATTDCAAVQIETQQVMASINQCLKSSLTSMDAWIKADKISQEYPDAEDKIISLCDTLLSEVGLIIRNLEHLRERLASLEHDVRMGIDIQKDALSQMRERVATWEDRIEAVRLALQDK